MEKLTKTGPYVFQAFKRLTRFDVGAGSQLPRAYEKFWKEWKVQQPVPVHYAPLNGYFQKNSSKNKICPVQNEVVPLIFPIESNDGVWGGEGIIKGFRKPKPQKCRVPKYWVPLLRRTVVHSKILNQHLSVVVTDRALNLIHEHNGFDHYLLKTPACDLQSRLSLKIKRKLLHTLLAECSKVEEYKSEIIAEFGKYMDQYTPEEIEWYGLDYKEAIKKLENSRRMRNNVSPHKIEFRSILLKRLLDSAND